MLKLINRRTVILKRISHRGINPPKLSRKRPHITMVVSLSLEANFEPASNVAAFSIGYPEQSSFAKRVQMLNIHVAAGIYALGRDLAIL